MRKTFLPLSVLITVLVLMVTVTCRANWICCEGDEWLSWDAHTRSIYIRAYIRGNVEGYAHGCAEMNSPYTMEAAQGCSDRAMIRSRDSSHFEDRITEFYKKFPQQKFSRISDILIGLYAGKTLEEIHNSFPRK
jgi:hypothetical protein